MSRRVVITGLGTVCGFGVGMDALWNGLLEGRTSIARISRFDPSGFPCRLGAEVQNFSAKDYVPKHYRKATKVMARDIELAVGAAKFAVEDAGLTTRASLGEVAPAPSAASCAPGDATATAPCSTTYRPARMGCHIGAGLIAAETEELTHALVTAKTDEGRVGGVDMDAWGRVGMDNLTPLWLLKYLPNMLACHVTIIHGTEGPSNTITCAEASGLLSIGESTGVISRGAADLCFSGGAESKMNLMGLLRMDLAGRVAHTGDATDPTWFLKPYDPNSPGGIIGEGGGIVVLEELEEAKKRGAKIYAEVIGFGAAHSAVLNNEGLATDDGCQLAIENAIRNAGISPAEIDAIVPLALGVKAADDAESRAFKAVFGDRLKNIPLITVSPNVGNCMAGIGGLQAAVAAKCLYEQQLPARIHGGTPETGIQGGKTESRKAELRCILVCSGSLGGQNAALVLRKAANI